ncbi:hypothetical protein ACIO8G_03315 [Streptomyces sp. NPDC087219]|uniref:hypothetical protein n=1 Tax=Streptomyces sp. NPDC087219 TaxID=3365770 RepID=UPI0037F396CA
MPERGSSPPGSAATAGQSAVRSPPTKRNPERDPVPVDARVGALHHQLSVALHVQVEARAG